MPAAEFEIGDDLVRSLLLDQFPFLSHLPLTQLANGWDNVMYRLGDEFTVRLPRRQLAVPLIEHEQRCLGVLAPRLDIPVPVPIAHGAPTDRFPMPWSICRWFPGEVASDVPLHDPHREAERLGAFLRALHRSAPNDAPRNQYRGQDVRSVEQRVIDNLNELGRRDGDELVGRWRGWAAAPVHHRAPLWLHGDLHTANVLVHDGAISAIIDFGDITAGDPAVDFPIAWMMFDADARATLRSAAGDVDDALWSRARAWALHFALMYLRNSADNPRLHGIGERLLATLLLEPTP